MSLSSKQAAQALREVEAVSQRSGQLYLYQRSAPMLILWGVIWAVGFSLNDFFPSNGNLFWPPLNCLGVAGCIFLGRRGKDDTKNHKTWRWLASILSILIFYVLVLAVMAPVSDKQSAVLISLIVALFYLLSGLWTGVRLAATGIALAGFTIFGYYALSAHFNLWMAAVGGGALILAGFWLRRT